MIFNYKDKISEKLKTYLLKYTTPDDVVMIASMSNINVNKHTLRRLRLGETNVSNERNAKAIIELMRIAIRRYNETFEYEREIVQDCKEVIQTFNSK